MAVEVEESNNKEKEENKADDVELNILDDKSKEEKEKKTEEDEKKTEEKAVDEEHGTKRDIWQNKYEYYAALIASSISNFSMNIIPETIVSGGVGMNNEKSILMSIYDVIAT